MYSKNKISKLKINRMGLGPIEMIIFVTIMSIVIYGYFSLRKYINNRAEEPYQQAANIICKKISDSEKYKLINVMIEFKEKKGLCIMSEKGTENQAYIQIIHLKDIKK